MPSVLRDPIVTDGSNVGMVQRRHRPRFEREPLDEESIVHQVGAKDLESKLFAHASVLDDPDFARPPPSEKADGAIGAICDYVLDRFGCWVTGRTGHGICILLIAFLGHRTTKV